MAAHARTAEPDGVVVTEWKPRHADGAQRPRAINEVHSEIRARPFTLRDPAEIARRAWISGHDFITPYVTVTAAPGGFGKTALAVAEALALVTGRPLLGVQPARRCRVWLWNEDPVDEMERRITAAAAHYGITGDEIGDRLLVNSARETPIILARQLRDGVRVDEAVVQALIAEIRGRRIDLVVIDPFVSSHACNENDNAAIDRVAKTWAYIAEQTGAAIHLVAHTRKNGGAEITSEDTRGAGALLAAARIGRVLNPMTEEEAKKAGVKNRREFFRLSTDKANMAPRSDQARWFRLTSFDLGNGGPDGPADHVGVVVPWRWPNGLDHATTATMHEVRRLAAEADPPYRANQQAEHWIGLAVAQATGLDPFDRAEAARINEIVRAYLASGALVEVHGAWRDSKRRLKPIIRPGDFKD